MEFDNRLLRDLTAAAQGGDFNAQFTLAVAYRFGTVVKRDFETSRVWLAKAASNNFDDLISRLSDQAKKSIEEIKNLARLDGGDINHASFSTEIFTSLLLLAIAPMRKSRLQDNKPFLVERPGRMRSIIDAERRYVMVSDGYARELGYRPQELIGKKLDDFTAPGTVDIDMTIDALQRLGELDGFWLLQNRSGNRVLVHYHATSSSGFIEARCEPIPLVT